jgi:DNA adenine methylase
MDVDSSRHSPDDPNTQSIDNKSSTDFQHVLIKWTGSKRRQARKIVAQFPRRIATYYEPFLGGGSVLYELLGSEISVGKFEVSDACEPLIALWKLVQNDPTGLIESYAENWRMLQVCGRTYYHEVRQAFNESQNPHLFFFLLRTCRNGLTKFNQAGEFNGSFHPLNLGMAPERVKPLAEEWHRRLVSKDINFYARDYREVTTRPGDVLYVDPPYETGEGRYYLGTFDFGELFGWLRKQQCDHFFSLNGFLGDEDRRLKVPADLYDRHRLLENGYSPLDHLYGRKPRLVTESLYIKRRCGSPTAVDDVFQPERPLRVPRQTSKSGHIRALLKDDPNVPGAEVVRRLAERGVEVDANLVRVVRHHAQKVGQWESRWCEAVCRQVEARLSLMITDFRRLKLPCIDNVRLNHDELMTLAAMIGTGMSEDHLFHLARALWIVRYARRTGQSGGAVEAHIASLVQRFKGDSSDVE